MTYFCNEGVFGWTARLARKITMGFCTETRHKCYTLSFIMTCQNEKLPLKHLCQSLPEHPVPPTSTEGKIEVKIYSGEYLNDR